MSEQREAIMNVLDVYLPDWVDEIGYQADSVIAHLWEQAMRPEVIKAVAEALYDLRVLEGNSLSHDGTLGGIPYVSWRNAEITKARTAITTLLIALLGPRPNEQEAE